MVWFGEIEGKLAKLSMTTFTYSSSTKLFYATYTQSATDRFAGRGQVVRKTVYGQVNMKREQEKGRP